MAELAAGTVSSLLCVIRNEALLLGGVRSDVQFIKEEMESMNSFLAHLARSAPRGADHDEQVRTWMNQVRLLAQDCNNCIDLYLYRGNPDVQRARGRIRRYLWWAYWFLHKLVAQHQAAIQLRELKERARDVGARRLRYGVEVPAKSAAAEQSPRAVGQSSWRQPVASAPAGCCAAGDDEEDGDDQLMVATATHYSGRRTYFEPPTLDEYVKTKLLDWIKQGNGDAVETLSLAILAPDGYTDILDLAREAFDIRPEGSGNYSGVVMVDISAVHPPFLPLRPKEVLYYILRKIKLEHSKNLSQEQDTEQGEGENLDSLEVMQQQWNIYMEKKQEFRRIKENINKMKKYEKLDMIKTDIQGRLKKGKQLLQQELREIKIDKLGLKALLQMLFLPSSVISQEDEFKNTVEDWDKKSIAKIAKMLKEHMEKDEKGVLLKEQGGGGGGVGGDGGEGQNQGGGGEGQSEAAAAAGGGEQNGAEERGGEREGEQGEAERERQEEDDHDSWPTAPIHLHEVQYERILRKVFPEITNRMDQGISAAKQATKTTLDEDQVKQMIEEAKQEILQKMEEGKHDKKETCKGEYEMDQETGEGKYNNNRKIGQYRTADPNLEKDFKQVNQKMDRIKELFKEQFKIKWLVDEIKHHLKYDRPLDQNEYKCPLFILKVDRMMDVSRWEDTREALSLLKLSADVLIITTTEDTEQATKYCYPPLEPIDYSPVGLYHYTVLECTSHDLKNKHNYNPQIFRDILKECESHDFCMRIFTHALYANPKRSNEELIKLYNTLHHSPKSSDIIAKMFKFCYSDLPKEYKSCLLYLAIFPPGHNMKRSTLIGRWVAEGLIFKEDWLSSVIQANRCFDTLINRWLVYPADIGGTGKVKSCVVGDIVHGLISKIARKQHILDPRLSHHLARHFSIFNDLHLRSSEGIQNFFKKLSESSRVSLLKVLDLEGCQCFGGNSLHYLKEICRKMLLLKYLSLRGTDITQLPREINYLRELEFLDIRQTKVPEYATRHVLLLKLKRLLAGHIDLSLSGSDEGTVNNKTLSTVQIPRKIGKMVNLEVLSNVKVNNSNDLKDIGKLCYLRKLGVVINNRHIRKLIKEINDLHEGLLSLSISIASEGPHSSGLHECLRSFSITATQEDSHSSEELQADNARDLKNLESLSISGEATLLSCDELNADIASHLNHHSNLSESVSIRGEAILLSLFAKPGNNNLAKVTLTSTLLDLANLTALAKLTKLQCVRLRRIECPEGRLTIEKGGFKCLKCLLVEDSNLTEIIFGEGAAGELEEMVLSSTKIESVSGVCGLEKLEKLELNNNENSSRLLSSFGSAKQIAKLTLHGTFLDISCDRSQITFRKGEFPKLSHLIVHGSTDTYIIFNGGSAPKIEKIVWSSFTSLSGIHNLPRLKELEFNGDNVPPEEDEAIKKHKNRPNLKTNKTEI